MSWGNKLVVVFIAFAALIGTLVYKSVTTKFELVTKNYYAEELRYQEKIDGAANAATAGAIHISQDQQSITVQLPETLTDTVAEGEAWFYCRTDAGKDRRLPVRIEDGKYSFDRSLFLKDRYELKLQFIAAGKPYYYTQLLVIQ
ncbi:MAG TPA: FixH family protein [Chitinophagaceae bacterium]